MKTSILSWSAALVAIAAVLATVAILQFRWADQASSAEEMRIGSELESLMMKWQSDLYGEFSAICVAMQVGPDSGARDIWNDYLERYVEWNYALPHQSMPYVYRNPDLVGEIYVLETRVRGNPRLLRLDPEKKRIEPSKIPLELMDLLPRLEANSSNLNQAMNAWTTSESGTSQIDRGIVTPIALAKGSNAISGWQFDVRVPALVHPILHHGIGKAVSVGSPVDWIIITIDMNVLNRQVLPKLAGRYFGGLDGLDYKVGVIATGPKPRTLYSSDPGFGAQDLGAVDSTLNIFRLQPSVSASDATGAPWNTHSLRSAAWHSFAGPEWFPVIEFAPRRELWFLEVEHRGGRLQDVVNGVRAKNLTMSALMLLLLAGNFAILMVAALRAQKFARLQMEFVASISHELRTPLAAIFSAGENIHDGVVTGGLGLPNYGSLIMNQSRQLMKHVDRILLFASIRSGMSRYHASPIDVSEILKCVRDDTASLIHERHFSVHEEIESNLPRVLGDMFAVRGCLENLISNAVKYSRNDRQIRITANLRRSASGAETVAIAVQDFGIGIKASDLKRIFEPFYRGQEAREAQIHGTGLGLSLAKHFAISMGGSLSVISKVGVGSIFTLHLGVEKEDPHEPVIAASRLNEGEVK
ncbi:MAG: HAMP domain-containing sensor histidine kinase [Formivibrio sp.]|nr:HAMP domain-containing sensor histidine kinase [Formivibrio sp.]